MRIYPDEINSLSDLVGYAVTAANNDENNVWEEVSDSLFQFEDSQLNDITTEFTLTDWASLIADEWNH